MYLELISFGQGTKGNLVLELLKRKHLCPVPSRIHGSEIQVKGHLWGEIDLEVTSKSWKVASYTPNVAT